MIRDARTLDRHCPVSLHAFVQGDIIRDLRTANEGHNKTLAAHAAKLASHDQALMKHAVELGNHEESINLCRGQLLDVERRSRDAFKILVEPKKPVILP